MPFDVIPYALNTVRDISPGVNGLALNPNARCAEAVEQAYAFFNELGPYAADLGPKRRDARAGGTAWRPNPTIAGFGVKLAGATGYFWGLGHQLRPWSRECLFVYGGAGAQGVSTIAEHTGDGPEDRMLYVDVNSKIAGNVLDPQRKTATGTTTLIAGQAYHAVVTATNSVLTVYLNGVSEGSVAVASGGYASYISPELVFGLTTGGVVPAGTVNTIFWSIEYSRALTAQDVRHRYLNQMEMFQLATDPFAILQLDFGEAGTETLISFIPNSVNIVNVSRVVGY